jgi:hypothetical protein
MKKSVILATTLMVATLILFNSCEPEVVNPPNLQVTPAEEITAAPGELVQYQITISSETDLSSLEVTVKSGENTVATADSIFPANSTIAVIDFPFIVPQEAEDASSYTVTFEAKNTSESSTVTRIINVSIPYGEINTYTAVILSDIENPNGSSFFSLDENKLMQLSAAVAESEKVDLIYYYGISNKATLCAPSDEEVEVFEDRNNTPIINRFATRNDTKLAMVSMSEDDFNAIANDGPIVNNEPESTSTAAKNLEVGNIIFAETVGAKKALILVKNITGTQGTSEITIEVKIQQ